MRLVVKYREFDRFEHINVTADRLDERDGILMAYSHGELVAAIKTDVFDMAYLSGEKEALT